MMKKIFLKSLLLIQFLLSSFSFLLAQGIPSNLGNIWISEYPDGGYIFKATLVDTNYFFNNNFYIKIIYSNSSNLFGYTRFNYTDSLYYNYSESYIYNNGDIPIYKLNCVLGDTFSYPLNQYARFTKEVIDAYQTNVFDTLVIVKIIHWSAGGLVEGTEIWTDEFGLMYRDQSSEGFVIDFVLRGCVINGKAYGDTSYIVSVDDEPNEYLNFKLYQNYPNPFNPATNIEYELKEYEYVNLSVYDLLGNEIALLVNEEKYPGKYSTKFFGNNLASGIYFYKLTIGGNTQIRKMMLLR